MLSGLLMWVAAVPAHTDGEFLAWSALLMAPSGWSRAGCWAGSPAGGRCSGRSVHRWCSTPSTTGTCRWWRARWARCTRCTAGVHPSAGRPRRRGRGAARARLRVQALPRCVRRPARAAGAHRARSRCGRRTGEARCASSAAAVATVVLVNLPFAIAGYEGWRASFTFQELRKVDITTNSDLVLGIPAVVGADEPGVPGGGGPALARAGAGVVHGRAGGGLAAVAAGREPTRGSGSAPRCCAGSCCCTRCTRRSTPCGCCRSSSCCGCAGGGSSPTWWRTSRCTSASSGCSTCSTPAWTSASGAGSPPRPW